MQQFLNHQIALKAARPRKTRITSYYSVQNCKKVQIQLIFDPYASALMDLRTISPKDQKTRLVKSTPRVVLLNPKPVEGHSPKKAVNLRLNSLIYQLLTVFLISAFMVCWPVLIGIFRVTPEAILCPPPPNFWAICPTFTPPRLRSEHLILPSGISTNNAATSTVRIRRHSSIRFSVSLRLLRFPENRTEANAARHIDRGSAVRDCRTSWS